MEASIRRRLLDLNRQFYDSVAAPFHETRRAWTPGKLRLLDVLAIPPTERRCRVADIGCGNARLALMLESRRSAIDYVGVDGNNKLLAYARTNTRALQSVRTRFVQADLACHDWSQALLDEDGRYEYVFCLATLQHIPSYELRRRLVAELVELLAKDGFLAISAWQFLDTQRFVDRLIDWEEIGLSSQDVDKGDALLPWKQDVHAIRYVHQVDGAEMARLADANRLEIVSSFRADGREGNLNLYTILSKKL